MDVVDMTGRPINNLLRRRQGTISAELTRRLCEVDPTKLLGYLGSVLPVDEPEFQAKYVIDRDGWLRQCIAILEAELEVA